MKHKAQAQKVSIKTTPGKKDGRNHADENLKRRPAEQYGTGIKDVQNAEVVSSQNKQGTYKQSPKVLRVREVLR